MRLLTLLSVFLLVLSGCSQNEDAQQSETANVPERQRPPLPAEDSVVEAIIETAVFTDLDGNDVTLEDFRGKVLVIDFWETWCVPCLQVFPSMQELVEEYPDDFAMLAVTLGVSEGPDDARAFRDANDYDFHYLVDSNRITNDIGVSSIPYKIYIAPDGSMIKQEIGTAGREGDYEGAKAIITEYRE